MNTTQQTTAPKQPSGRYAKQTEYSGIQMTLIGEWMDLAAYYAGSDGNAWTYQSRFVNEGNLDQFRATFSSRRHGHLFA